MDSTPERKHDMSTAYLTVTPDRRRRQRLLGPSRPLLRMQAIVPGMAKAGVPVSWLRFPKSGR